VKRSGPELRGLIDAVIAAADPGTGPEGWPVRLLLATSLYGAFDRLRCREAPFDRAAYAEHLGGLKSLARALERAGPPSPPKPISGEDLEEKVDDLYSRCWANYSDQAFVETVQFFRDRFVLNEVDLGFLKGARCLDAGCGSGRYTVAMAHLGAGEAVGVDLSRRAVEWARAMAHRLRVAGVEFVQSSVLDLPVEWNGRFDFVCSNGVVHHTRDWRRGVRETYRVLRPGGLAYVFVYGAGGLFWELVDRCRALLAPVPLDTAEGWLKALGTPEGKIFNFLDHWYTPIQGRLVRAEFEAELKAAGFVELRSIPRAYIYDASERLARYPDEGDLVGEGDLRYLARKPER
jgi:SAM-dependent methyltransferase